MRRFLIFHLYGPMAAWGEAAVGEYRPSAAHPGKSAVTGLLAAALGIRRDEEEKNRRLAESYGLGVRVDAGGELLRDYHTIQVPPARRKARYLTRRDELAADNRYTILSQRDYRVEAAWTCALWAGENAPQELEALADALCRPRFTLYLGRKSCLPALPLNPKVVETETLREAFDAHPPPEDLQELTRGQAPRYFWEQLSAEETGFEATWVAPRRDKPLSRKRWQFGLREEFHTQLPKGETR
ncbi:MAG: type I-E CRISPR-associated protein Cas5/CasD [Methylohalobius sp. ZOD2]